MKGLRCLFWVWVLFVAVSLRAAPETTLLYGPEGVTHRRDVVFGWIGVPDEPTNPLRGYRYSLDGGPALFTQKESVAFFGLGVGEHRFRVSAVNAQLEEDPTPAELLFTVTGTFSDEIELNETPTTASLLVSGTEIHGISGGEEDVDVYRISLSGEQGTVTFRRPFGGTGKTTVEIYRQDPVLNDRVGTLVASSENGQRVALTFGTTPGIHYVRVRADANETIASPYVLTLTGETLPLGSLREVESNGSETSANEASLSAEMPLLNLLGTIHNASDVDWYRIRLDVGRVWLLRVTFSRQGAGGEALLDAFLGTPPVTEHQVVSLKTLPVNDQFATFIAGVTLGELWLRVQSESSQDPYRILLSLSEPPGFVEVEPNNVDPRINSRSPTLLPLGTTLLGTTWEKDLDWFRIEVSRGGLLRLSLDRPEGIGSTRVRLFDAGLNPLTETMAHLTSRGKASLTALVNPGTFYVEVSAKEESPTLPYRLRATFEVLEAVHSGTRPLRRGETLRVRLTAPAGGQATFRLGESLLDLELFDDGSHDDGAANDGVYVGTYVVQTGDELRNVPVVVRYRDASGSESSETVPPNVTLDAVAPPPVSGVVGNDRPDDEGFWVSLRWDISRAPDVLEYRIYLSEKPFDSVEGQTPIGVSRRTNAEIPVERNRVDYYFAVTAVDVAGNESALGATSKTGAVQALEEIRLEPIRGVSVADTPDDFGGQVTVQWAASPIKDFAEYRVYVDNAPLTSVEGRTPAVRLGHSEATSVEVRDLPDGVPVFVAVTALDRFGNESPLGEGSVGGPAVPTPNVVLDTSDLNLRGPVGLLRSSEATFFWNRFREDGSLIGERYAVSLDGRSPLLTSGTTITLSHLSPGRHTVRVSALGIGLSATHGFSVGSNPLPESEPNNSSETATPAMLFRTYWGTAGDEGDFYRIETRSGEMLTLTGVTTEGEVTFRLFRDLVSEETLVFAFPLDARFPMRSASTATHQGTWFVEVFGSGEYRWTIQTVPLPPGQTAEEEPKTALVESLPRGLRGASQADGDVDAFDLAVPGEGNLTLKLYRPFGSGETRLLMSRRERPVASLSLEEDTSETLILRVAPDTYRLTVENERVSDAEYHIALTWSPSNGPRETEPNDLPNEATPLPTEVLVRGNSWNPDDRDTYRLSFEEGGTLVVTFSRPEGIGKTRLRLRNLAGTELVSSIAEPPNGHRTQVQTEIPPGVYLLSVEPEGEGKAPYELSAFRVGFLRHSADEMLSLGDTVTVHVGWRVGGSVSLSLRDSQGNVVQEGIPATDETGKGLYRGTLTLTETNARETLILLATLRFGDASATLFFPTVLRVDVAPLIIASADHDAKIPLKAGEVLRVTASAPKGLVGKFDILRADGTPFRLDLPLLDDGTLGDATAHDGVYIGRYVVVPGDEAKNALVRIRFQKGNGQTATRILSTPVTLDTTPPPPVAGVVAEDAPHDEGGFLRIRWNPSPVEDFGGYRLYVERSPIGNVRALTPLPLDLFRPEETEVLLPVEDETSFYVAVMALDKAGNMSSLDSDSVSGPVRAQDNLAPPPVSGVRVFDRPYDAGGMLSVRWEPSLAPDFAEYRLYVAAAAFGEVLPSPALRIPLVGVTASEVPTSADGIPFYVAVTAVDASGNESSPSVAGPMASVGDFPPSEGGVPIFVSPSAWTRHSTAFFQWARFVGEKVIPAYRISLDGVTQVTQNTDFLWSNLREGKHRFSVEPVDGSLPASERVFLVEPLLLPEKEPNGTKESAFPLPLGVGVEGNLHEPNDVDWYRVSVGEPGLLTLLLSRLDKGEISATPQGGIPVLADGVSSPETAAVIPVSPGEFLVAVSGMPGRYRLAVSAGTPPERALFESEPNDSPALATLLREGDVEVTGTLLSNGEEDWFRFESGSVGILELLFFPQVEAELSVREGVIAQTTSSTLRVGARTGTYFLKVTGSQRTRYTFRVHFSEMPSKEMMELEPNNTPRRATPIASEVVLLRGVLEQGASDWYRFEVAPGSDLILHWTVTASVSAVGSVGVFAEEIPVGEGTFGETLSLATRGGTYFLEVRGNTGEAFAYEILLSRQAVSPTLDVEYEPNENPTIASPLRLGVPLTGSLWNENDMDLYRVEVTPEGFLVVSVEGGISGEVLDASQRRLVEISSLGTLVSVAVPATGRLFFVRIQGARGDYRLCALHIKRAEHNAHIPLGIGGKFTLVAEMPSGWKVEVEIGGTGIRFPLVESGSNAGVYTGSYVVQAGDNAADATLSLRIETPRGIVGYLPVSPALTLDTAPPLIRDVIHTAVNPLKSGDVLLITARSEPNTIATFEIIGEGFTTFGELHDDGNHNDDAPNDGLYAGSYRVGAFDNVREALLRVRFVDTVGNEAVREAIRRITLDTTPPVVAEVQHDGTRILKTGDVLTVRVNGEPGATGTFSLGGIRENLPLYDDGTHGDTTPGDGLYIGTLPIREGDNAAEALLTVRFVDLAGNVTSVVAPLPVGVDTTPPSLISVTHNATRPLRKGEKLIVQLRGEPNGTAFFDIGTERLDIPLFDDGSGDDTTPNDGIYTGSYLVAENDDLSDVLILGRLLDAYGNLSRRAAARRVTLDAVPPEPVTGLVVEDVPNDDGNRLRLIWNPVSNFRQFHRYQVYRQTSPIRITKGLLPLSLPLGEPERTEIIVEVPANDVDYYFAVTALDTALNESPLGEGSTTGPVRAKDNTPPASVTGVTAADAPSDDGKTLLVSWESENEERDFSAYAVFVSRQPLRDEDLVELVPAKLFPDRTVRRGLVPTPEDNVNFYVAVTATDINGNRSRLVASSLAGPVQSVDNQPPSPVLGVEAVDTPGDDGRHLLVSWEIPKDITVTAFEIYRRLDPIQAIRPSEVPAAVVRRTSLPEGERGNVEIETVSDGVDTYVAVVAVDGGGNRSSLTEDSVGGPVRSVANRVRAGIAATIRAGFDNQASVSIPAEASRPGMRVDILRLRDPELLRHVEEANAHLTDANIDETTELSLRETILWFQTDETLFVFPVRITLGYPALESPEMASELRIFRLNTSGRLSRWELVTGTQTVDEKRGVVSAETRVLGVFRVARLLLPQRLTRMVFYPNPFSPERDRVLTFRNLTRDARVDIFTLDGRRVRSLVADVSGVSQWDGRNEKGEWVASGLYFFLVRGGSDRRTGQVFVRR